MPVFLPLLPSFPPGNALFSRKGQATGTPLSEAEAHSRLANPALKGRRGQTNGVCYDERLPGLHPAVWPHVAVPPAGTHGAHRFLLEVDGGSSSVVDIHYSDPDPRLLEIAEQHLAAKNNVRETELGVGAMVFVGDHLWPDGFVKRSAHAASVPSGAREIVRRAEAAGMEVAGRLFAREFAQRGVGWSEMMAEQAEVWPKGTPAWPQCWSVSGGLGNAMHRDPDSARSYAGWFARRPGSSRGWWFLLPRHGLAIPLVQCVSRSRSRELALHSPTLVPFVAAANPDVADRHPPLRSGTWISWDGRCVEHCTACPDVADGDALVSLFCSLPERTCNALERRQMCESVLTERGAELTEGQRAELMLGCDVGDSFGRARELMASLSEGMTVRYRWALPCPEGMGKRQRVRWGQSHHRFVTAKVVSIEADLSAMWVKEEGNSRCTRLTKAEVWKWVVR